MYATDEFPSEVSLYQYIPLRFLGFKFDGISAGVVHSFTQLGWEKDQRAEEFFTVQAERLHSFLVKQCSYQVHFDSRLPSIEGMKFNKKHVEEVHKLIYSKREEITCSVPEVMEMVRTLPKPAGKD